MLVALRHPILFAGRTLEIIELRPPGRHAFERMRLDRAPLGFTDEATARIAARLSEHGESTYRRLAPDDLAAVKAGLDELYRVARRRFIARTALAETSRAQQRAQREADDA